MRISHWVLLMLLLAPKSFGAATLASDFLVGGSIILNQYTFYSHNTFYLHSEDSGFGLGALFQFDSLGVNARDLVYGGGIRFGASTFLSIEGGVLFRTVWEHNYEFVRKGIAAYLTVGHSLTSWFRLTLPLSVKYFSSGPKKGFKLSVLPHIGFKLTI